MLNKIKIFFGIASTGTGAYLLAYDNTWLKILGAIVTVFGAYFTYVSSIKNSSNDKNEILNRIDEFKDKLEDIKSITYEENTKEKIEEIESEFDKWAKNLNSTVENRKLEIQSKDIELEEKKLRLTREYRKIYIKFFSLLDGMIKACNKGNQSKIEITGSTEMPLNLFSKQGFNFKKILKFNADNYWYVNLYPTEPLKEDKIPRIKIFVQCNDKKPISPALGEDLEISFDLKRNKIELDNENFFRKHQFSFESNLDKFELSFQEILKQAFEYQLARL